MAPNFGKAVVDGQLRYLSVSALEKFDPRSGTGCPRKYWYRYVAGKPEPTSDSMAKGIALHKEIEHYLKTGEKTLSPLALRGLHLLPKPGKDLWIEQAIHTVHNGTITSPLTAAGVPFVGFIDILHRRGTNQGTDDINEANDPPGTVAVEDIKWKGNASWKGQSSFKRPDELIKTIQMSGYGEFVRRSFPMTKHVRLSHLYFPVKGGVPTKVTRLHVVEDCRKAWEYAEGLAEAVKDVAKEADVERVPVNIQACGAYGGCPHAAYCSKGRVTSMGLLEDLKAEETKLRDVVVAQQGATNAFIATWEKIKAFGRGYPALEGIAQASFCDATETPFSSTRIEGAGQLGALTLREEAHVFQLAEELARELAKDTVSVQPVLPPDAPSYAQEHAFVDPDAPKKRGRKKASEPKADTAHTVQESIALASPPAAPSGSQVAPSALSSTIIASHEVVIANVDCGPETRIEALPALSVFVDCIPNMSCKSLHEYLEVILGDLVERHCKDGIRDVRCASNDSPLAFGRWRGVLAHAIKENPPARGMYCLDTRGSEVAEVAADALRGVATVYVRGVR